MLDTPSDMTAAVLHGAKDIRIERMPAPTMPGPGEAILRVRCVGVCGSDLHMYQDGRIGEMVIHQPIVIGHEFGGVIEEVGQDARDGNGTPLPSDTPDTPLTRVAVDPAIPASTASSAMRGTPTSARTTPSSAGTPRPGRCGRR